MKKTEGSPMNEPDVVQLLDSLPNPQIGDLHNWLYEATQGLCAPAKATIAKEIEEHFHAAVEDGLAEGLTQIQAELRAMQGLGSPKAARREFRKVYATELQHRWARYGRQEFTRRAKALQLAFGLIALCALIILMLKEDVPSRNAMGVYMMLATGSATLILRWSKKWAPPFRDALTEVAIILQLFILHSAMDDWQPITGAMLLMATIAFPASVLYMLIVHYINVSDDGRPSM
ncbi:MAG: hypothetical protein IT368_05045 [Candidatus Hydrogenedentes bacterium]|nr:hypothetical protein [Candidatus Hydrogenedentota bacterium]